MRSRSSRPSDLASRVRTFIRKQSSPAMWCASCTSGMLASSSAVFASPSKSVERTKTKASGPEPQGLGVDPRLVPLDHPPRLQPADALQHGRRRHLHLPGDLGVGGPGVLLKDRQDLAVDFVDHSVISPPKQMILPMRDRVQERSTVKCSTRRSFFGAGGPPLRAECGSRPRRRRDRRRGRGGAGAGRRGRSWRRCRRSRRGGRGGGRRRARPAQAGSSRRSRRLAAAPPETASRAKGRALGGGGPGGRAPGRRRTARKPARRSSTGWGGIAPVPSPRSIGAERRAPGARSPAGPGSSIPSRRSRASSPKRETGKRRAPGVPRSASSSTRGPCG